MHIWTPWVVELLHGRRNRSGRPGGCRTSNLTNKNFYDHVIISTSVKVKWTLIVLSLWPLSFSVIYHLFHSRLNRCGVREACSTSAKSVIGVPAHLLTEFTLYFAGYRHMRKCKNGAKQKRWTNMVQCDGCICLLTASAVFRHAYWQQISGPSLGMQMLQNIFRETKPPGPWPGAMPLDPAGGSAQSGPNSWSLPLAVC